MKMKVKKAGFPLGMKGSAPAATKRRKAPAAKKVNGRKMTAKQMKYFGKRKKKR